MVRIKHIGHGWLTNQGGETPLKFASESEAREFLAASGEEKNIGIDWEIIWESHMNIYTYRCVGNNKVKTVTAHTLQGARNRCMELYGFWPTSVENLDL